MNSLMTSHGLHYPFLGPQTRPLSVLGSHEGGSFREGSADPRRGSERSEKLGNNPKSSLDLLGAWSSLSSRLFPSNTYPLSILGTAMRGAIRIEVVPTAEKKIGSGG